MSVAAESKTYFNFINGRWVKAESGGMEQSLNPADTRDIVGLVQKSSIEDVDRAVEVPSRPKRRGESCRARSAVNSFTRPLTSWNSASMKLPNVRRVKWAKHCLKQKAKQRGESRFSDTMPERGRGKQVM